MKLTNSKLGLIQAGILAIAAPAFAQAVDLTPDEAAGKIIFARRLIPFAPAPTIYGL